MLEKARSLPESRYRKILCLTGMQSLFRSYEDSALLLYAVLEKKNGKHIHCALGVESQGEKRGSTGFPRILKKYQSGRQILDNLGFTSITNDCLKTFGLEISEDSSGLTERSNSVVSFGDRLCRQVFETGIAFLASKNVIFAYSAAPFVSVAVRRMRLAAYHHLMTEAPHHRSTVLVPASSMSPL